MNQQIRRAVRVRLAERDLNQHDLANLVGMSPQYVSRLMTGKVGQVPDTWQKLLNALDLELVAVNKRSREDAE